MDEQRDYESLGLITYVLCVVLMVIGGGTLQHWDLHIGVALSQLLFILVPGLVLLRILPKRDDKPAPKFDLKIWVWVLVATPIVALASNSLATIFVQLFDAQQLSDSYAKGIDDLLRPEETWRQIAGIVSICIVAPFCEEVLFRGGILRAQLTKRPFLIAAIINGLLFSALHMNPIGFVSLAIIGAFFATVSRGGLLLAMFSHAVLNFVSGVLPLFAIDSAQEVDEIALHVLIPMFIGLSLVAAVCWRQTWLALERNA